MTDLPALWRAESSLRAYATRGRLVVPAGALTLFVTTNNRNPFLSVAVPNETEPDSWDDSVTCLLKAAAEQRLRPRLEFMAELHPGLAASLTAAGFHATGSAPVMVLATAALARPPHTDGTRFRLLSEVDDATLGTYLDGQSRAFEMPLENGRSWLPVLREGLTNGAVRGALLEDRGRIVAGATLQMAQPAAELAGVWTTAERRHHGLASTVCHGLLLDAARDGLAEAWLSAAESALGLYRRLGFRTVGTQRNFER